jgi:hypothetical protein
MLPPRLAATGCALSGRAWAKAVEQSAEILSRSAESKPAWTGCSRPNAAMCGRRSCRSSRVPSTAPRPSALGKFSQAERLRASRSLGFAPDETPCRLRGWWTGCRSSAAASVQRMRISREARTAAKSCTSGPRLNNAGKANGAAHAVPRVETQKPKTATTSLPTSRPDILPVRATGDRF